MVRVLLGFLLGIGASYGATAILAEVTLSIDWTALTDVGLSVPW